jgi:capsular polysaccharide export protein
MQRILFISAPFGPFFKHAARKLCESGHSVWRIVWEGGDFVETPLRYQVPYWGGSASEEDFLRRVLKKRRITAIITYNDTGRRNQLAIRLARQSGIPCYVLENGYLRPHWVTLDREGVNGYSQLPKDPAFYRSFPGKATTPATFPVSMRDHVRNTMKHFAASLALWPILPFDPRYYGDALWRQARYYAKEYLWRITHTEKHKTAEIVQRKQEKQAKIFVVLMQKPGDAQLRVHSQYKKNRPFLTEVCKSFAAHAPKDAILIVKQHPYDYGVERLPQFFRALTARLGIENRAYYLRKTSIDIVFDHTDGLITVNSTGGLSAVIRGLPVMCCGKAIFNMAGLTFQGGLDRFWRETPQPCRETTSSFVAYLQAHSQINGGFHSLTGMELAAQALTRIITENSLAPHLTLAYSTGYQVRPQAVSKLPLGGLVAGGQLTRGVARRQARIRSS